MELVLIAAVAANGVIGRDGSLPWHLPADLAHFKQTTMDHPVIMGRVAFEDILDHIGEPLPGRTNIVLTRSAPDLPPGVIVANDIESAIDAAVGTGAERAFVAGGRTVYDAMLSRADRMILTELAGAYDGDVTFPAWDPAAWAEVARESHEEFDIVEYEAVNGGS